MSTKNGHAPVTPGVIDVEIENVRVGDELHIRDSGILRDEYVLAPDPNKLDWETFLRLMFETFVVHDGPFPGTFAAFRISVPSHIFASLPPEIQQHFKRVEP